MKYLWIIFLCFLNLSAFANFTPDSDMHVANLLEEDINGVLDMTYQELTKKIPPEDEDILTEIELNYTTETERLAKLKSYFAFKSYEYYKTVFLSQLKAESKKTGREIYQENYKNTSKMLNYPGIIESETCYWLDRGANDKKECQDAHGHFLCDFPDGYEEFLICIREDDLDVNGLARRISIIRDIKNKNKHIVLVFNLSSLTEKIETKTESYQNYIFSQNWGINFTQSISSYEEEQRFRNLDAADARAGKYTVQLSGMDLTREEIEELGQEYNATKRILIGKRKKLKEKQNQKKSELVQQIIAAQDINNPNYREEIIYPLNDERWESNGVRGPMLITSKTHTNSISEQNTTTKTSNQ